MLNREVLLESPLMQDELLARLDANLKPLPGYATWLRWPRDKTLWGATSHQAFQVQLGRARQLVSAKGQVLNQQHGSTVRISVGFKTWVIPYLIFSALSLLVVGVLISAYFRDASFALAVAAIAVLAFGSNVGLGLMQQRDLVRALQQIVAGPRGQ